MGFEIVLMALAFQGALGLVSLLMKQTMPRTKSRERIPACALDDWTKPGKPDWYFTGGQN